MTAQPLVGQANGHAPVISMPEWITRDQVSTRRAAPVHPATNQTEASASTEDLRAELDADLQKTVRQTSYMRRLFYVVVLLVALAGQVSGAVEALGIPLIWAIPAVAALEVGGIVVLNNADVRRRLGERATGSRILSVMIAAWAVAFNWLAHDNKLLAGFFAGMSALGYCVWVMHTENQRRDRLRATGDLPPTAPAYELWGHWVAHPWLTRRARSLAKQYPHLTLYTSLDEARSERIRQARTSAIAKVVAEEIRAKADPAAARIALAVYDLNEVAVRLAEDADYGALTALVSARLNPNALVNGSQTHLDAHPGSAPQTHPSDAFEVLPAAASGTHLTAVEGRVPDAPGVASVTRPPDALRNAPTVEPPDASTAPELDASEDRIQPRPVLPLKRASGASSRARQNPEVTRLLKHAANAGKAPSIREVQKLLNVGAPKAKALMQEAGLLPANTQKEN
jgi:hypothetical protein